MPNRPLSLQRGNDKPPRILGAVASALFLYRQLWLPVFLWNLVPMHIVRQDQCPVRPGIFFRNPHMIEGAIYEDQGNQKEEYADTGLKSVVRHGDGDFDRQ